MTVKNTLILLSLVFLFVIGFPYKSNSQRISGTTKAVVKFEEMPNKVSAISWVHDNAHSPERFLPETVGAGCAFLDFDNDGWMDVYLVNSGAADFFSPTTSLKNALYRNNHDGSFTDVTDKAGVAGGRVWGGGGVAGYEGGGVWGLSVTKYCTYLLDPNKGKRNFSNDTRKAEGGPPRRG